MKTIITTLVIVILASQVIIPVLMSRSAVYYSIGMISPFGENLVYLCENYVRHYDTLKRGVITQHCTDMNSALHDAWLAVTY